MDLVEGEAEATVVATAALTAPEAEATVPLEGRAALLEG